MRKMPEIKAENGFVTSIDGNAIPVTKLYSHYIVFNNTNTDKCYAFLVDDNPNSYKSVNIMKKHPNLTIPCYGQKIADGKACQYIDVVFDPTVGYGLEYMYTNLESNIVGKMTDWKYGSVIKSDTVTPLN